MASLQSIPVFDFSGEKNVARMPGWIRQSLATDDYSETAKTIHNQKLHTVCEEARCPNRGDCWSRGTATFMLLGDTCTRACGFCAVKTGKPLQVDPREPQRVATAIAALQCNYVVLTSVNRDELADGGATIFAETMQHIYALNQDIGLELLTPDFRQCQQVATDILATAVPTDKQWVWGHNIETVPSLYKRVRKGSRYERTLDLLRLASVLPNITTKSAIMLGIGEQDSELEAVFEDLYKAGVRRLAIGQYLRPSRYHLPVQRYITPAQFLEYKQLAHSIGFTWVQSGPMVRSSYHAEE